MNTKFCRDRNHLSAHWYRIAQLFRRGQASMKDYQSALGAIQNHQIECPVCQEHLQELRKLGYPYPHAEEAQ